MNKISIETNHLEMNVAGAGAEYKQMIMIIMIINKKINFLKIQMNQWMLVMDMIMIRNSDKQKYKNTNFNSFLMMVFM